ncbi:hypothetical protein HPE56_09590 [Maribacter sp. ANRC-HE7]|uniref:Lipocalin-like domain-containing protein n=1 Tax=Maribacter aquimaris TaxID=2737171 RepID=A0ABR7V154_9FLAO|nr:hypothetical protein [Maribacter aquimaris]MBD0778045.1 hypothetical protein [Maribacter aquimaris]
METIHRKSQIVFLALFLMASSITWSSENSNATTIDIPAFNEALVGTYEYTVDNVLYEYSKGLIVIDKLDTAYTVKIKLEQGELEGKDVEVVGNSIKFNLFIEGQTVAVELTATSDGISGKSSTNEGTFMVKGKRRS